MGSNMLLSIGALVIIGLFMLSSNTVITSSTQTMIRSEHYITAIALAQSIIDEAKTKAFDQKVIGKTLIKPESLTTSTSLGADGSVEAVSVDYVNLSSTGMNGERLTINAVPRSQSLFNDVDDYNRYTRIVRTPSNGVDTLRCSISYARLTYPDSLLTTQSFCKHLKISITGQFFPGALSLEYSYIF